MAASSSLRFLSRLLPLSYDPEFPPFGLQWRSNTFFIIATVGLGMVTDLFLFSLIVPVFPFMLKDRLGTPPEEMQTLVDMMLSIYAAASMVASPISGFLSDRMAGSRQIPFLFALFMLFMSTILLGVGQSVVVLAIARFLQGASSGVVWTIGQTICLETVGAENLGKTIGTIYSFVTCGTLFAPVLGGLLYEKTGYIGVFAAGEVLLVVDFFMRLLVIEKKVAARYLPVQLPSNLDGPSHLENGSQSEPVTETTALLATSPRSDSEIDGPHKLSIPASGPIAYLPVLACFKSPALIVSQVIGILQAIILSGFDATVPLIASEWYGYTSLKAGMLFLPLGVASLIIDPIAGWSIDIFGTKPICVFGFSLLTPAFLLMRLPGPGGNNQKALYCILLALCGCSLTIAGTPGIVEVGAVVERYHNANPGLFGENGPYAQMYGLTSMLFSLGLTLGPLVAGGLRELIGYGNMNTVLSGLCCVTGILAWLYLGNHSDWKKVWAPWASKTT